MSLPIPKLDDKDFDTLVREAIRMIPERCPNWTDFNPSDPGVTLIELMAWMTEVMLYRLNRVPEKSYIKFLELMGVKLAPPRPARSWVVFELAKRAKEEVLPVIEAGTRVSTKPGGEEPVVFETTKSLNLTAAKIKALCSRVGDWSTPHSVALLLDGKGQKQLFGASTRVSHCLYLGSERFKELPWGGSILVKVELADQSATPRIEIEWEAWDGIAWAPLYPLKPAEDWALALRSSGSIAFQPNFKLEPCLVNSVDSVWLRARLLSADSDQFPMLSRVQAALSLTPEHAKPPDAVFQRIGAKEDINEILQSVDLNAEVEPFGKKPEPNNALFIFSLLFGRPGATCRVRFFGPQKQSSAGSEQKVDWQYWCAEERWQDLESEHELLDGTNALIGGGTLSFTVPKDIAQSSILGHNGYAIRARLESPVSADVQEASPTFSAIRISFTEPQCDFDAYIREDYGAFEKLVIAPGCLAQPFSALVDQGPTFCLALDSRPAKRSCIYFQLEERVVVQSPRVVWEYWVKTEGVDESKGKWCELSGCKDTTGGLTTSGTLDFPSPTNWQPGSPEQGVEGYWLRARWVVGESSLSVSVLKGIHLNATDVIEGRSNQNKALGSSNGEPFQTFAIEGGEGRVLPGISLLVKELERPSLSEVEDLRTRLRTILKDVKDEVGKFDAVYSRWYEVENFFKSDPDDCHYTFDQRRGSITFGDGRNGRIPPTGRDNIIAERYCIGGGVRGNVGRDTIKVLEVAKDFVKGVSNVEPAQGGTDVETIEAAKLRGPWALRHRYRAVTREDFERLAKEASAEVALAKCFSPEDTGAEGEAVLVVIVPARDEIGARLRPSSRLLETVRRYLDERRLITTTLDVVGPDYDDLDIEVVPVLKTRYAGSFPEVQREINRELKRMFDPLKGGPEGNGWPMGRTVHISELYYLLERVRGVEYLESLGMAEHGVEQDDAQVQTKRDRIKIGLRSFPYCRQIQIAEG